MAQKNSGEPLSKEAKWERICLQAKGMWPPDLPVDASADEIAHCFHDYYTGCLEALKDEPESLKKLTEGKERKERRRI